MPAISTQAASVTATCEAPAGGGGMGPLTVLDEVMMVGGTTNSALHREKDLRQPEMDFADPIGMDVCGLSGRYGAL